jgi:hypothetical protein
VNIRSPGIHSCFMHFALRGKHHTSSYFPP